jgi:Fe-S cluster assembly iron-binding protein IscA
MGIEVTQEAAAVLRRSLELGGVDPSGNGGVRLRGSHGLGGGFDIQVELAEGPLEGDSIIDGDGLRLFVDPRVTESIPEAVVAVEPQHQTVVVRPADPSAPE